MMKERSYNNWLVFAGILLLAFLTRLPQITSPLFFPDGDECVVGLMAKHIADGTGFPVYYYGQKYGFALFEALPAAAAFKIFGVSAFALKLSMLFVWCFGVWFFYKAMRLLNGPVSGWLMLIFLIMMPAWEAWSMKARGGYNTAFVFSGIAFYLLVGLIKNDKTRVSEYLILGMVTAVILAAQPLWLPGLVPFFLYLALKKKDYVRMGVMAAGFAGAYILIMALATIEPNIDYWHPDIFAFCKDNAVGIPHRIFEMMHGSTTIFDRRDIGYFTDISTYLWVAGAYGFLLLQIWRIIKKKQLLFGSLIGVSMLLTLSYLMFFVMRTYNPRHLLPLAQWIAGGLAFELGLLYKANHRFKIAVLCYSALLVLTGFFSALEFRKLDEVNASLAAGHTRLGDMENFVNTLTKRNVHFFYAIDPIAEWQIIFLSNEKLIGRSSGPIDRYPKYYKPVDDAFENGKPFALTGSHGQLDKYVMPHVLASDFNHRICSCTNLCAYVNPDKALWERVKTGLP